MTIDVEEYFQVWALSQRIDRNDWDGFAPRVEDSTRRILDLLAEKNATATFFTLGWVAERAPKLMRDIARAGHEVGSHGYDHRKVFDMRPEEFFDDLRRTKIILEDASETPVFGYRAPGFSIDASVNWAYDVLAETGHLYSSSVHPIAHDHYDGSDAPELPYLPAGRDGVVEIPMATVTLFGKRRPCAGGGYFRLLPYQWTKYCLKRLEATSGRGGVFYFHPWEIDADQPKVRGLPLKSRFRHYVNLDRMEHKLAKLMSDFKWRRMDDVFREEIYEKPESLLTIDRGQMRDAS
ncbi:MAG: DUF3473 domain-containing protein [Parvularculaceae bacterium]